jgi:hypothetical protein
MALSQTERPAYCEEQYLNAADLTAAVDYARIQQARHALGGHTWGIAMGLDLRETPEFGGTVSVHVLPGYAWDGYGRPIVVLSPYRIPEEKFASFIFDPAIDSTGRLVPIWLAYYESSSAANAGFDRCAGATSYSRIQETFRIEVGEMNAAERISGINVAGRSLSDPKTVLREFDPGAPLIYDQSVPHQEYSTVSVRARWLIPIGFVRWQPVQNQPGHFVARDDSGTDKDSDKIRRVRRYAGLVAAEIGAADNVIRLRNRGRDPANSFTPLLRGQPDDVAVLVEGTVHLEGDSSYYGGGVDFRTHDGTDLGTPMSIRRNDAQPTKRALQLVIGPSTQLTNQFAIGTLDGDNFEEKFVFLSGGNAGIGTATPTDKLHVAGDLRISGLSRKPGGGSWTSSSDIRLKKEVAPLTDALEKVLQLHGFSFEWKEPEKMGDLKGPQIGLVAQDVEKVFPEWVSDDPDGYRELTVRGFEALAIEAIRELKAEVDDLKTRISELETAKPKQRPSKSKGYAKNRAAK